uniref:Uncharacterized protein n=1 Tax=Balaenoptera musculus TaxID=9771 RepID=A0A8C0DSM5_BALMU
MAVAAWRDPAQIVSVEERMRRFLLSRVFLEENHKSGLLSQFHRPRRLIPVRSVSQS